MSVVTNIGSVNINGLYTHPVTITYSSPSASTFTSSEFTSIIQEQYVIIYYNKINNKMCAYLSIDFGLTKNIDNCKFVNGIELSENLIRENIGEEYLNNIFNKRFYSFKYRKLYKTFFNGMQRNDVKLMAIKKDIEIRRIKLRKIKLKLN